MTTTDKTKWDERTKKIIAATVAKDLNPNGPDMAHFEHLCISKGLDPLAKEVWCVMRGGKPTFMLSIDGFLKLANSTGQLDGIEIEFFDGDGNGSEVWLSNSAPAACVARAYRKGCSRPFSASCRHAAYAQNSPLWKKLPEVMLSKVATTLALRRGFSDVLAGLHSPEEMDQSGMVPAEALVPGVQEVPSTPSALQALRDSGASNAVTVVETVEQPEATSGPVLAVPIADSEQSAIYKKALKKATDNGLTTVGWLTLQRQVGGVLTDHQLGSANKNGVFENQEKINFLNAGLTTFGVQLPVPVENNA